MTSNIEAKSSAHDVEEHAVVDSKRDAGGMAQSRRSGSSSTTSHSSDISIDSVSTDDMLLNLAQTSAKKKQERGRSRERSSRLIKSQQLRTKFIIESLYIQASELKKQNEILQKIWRNIQQTNQIQQNMEKLGLEGDTAVPCTVVDISDSNDDTDGACSDLEASLTDRLKGNDENENYDYTNEEATTEDLHELLYS